ncbi:hypothetical protein QFZ31_005753 [Neobacillus niacini]|uniref:hypothetical protein n=1 Tax=Neobacillus driksii TaxID=3035913 RepID=UPI0027870F4C|nr:hypothetical protein [Neobacillus niacini]MDQ0975875.1 hypothetical protein [Neobacillus niacini]
MSIVRLDSYKLEKQYAEYYKFSNGSTSNQLHTSERNIDFYKQYTAAYIKLLTSYISKKDGES